MPNDTTTLNGALRQLGETMAANLTTQGVPSTYDEGLTTLAGKILDIQGGGVRTLTLTSDKDILSYVDSESATLTATLLEDGVGVSGATVEFFNGSTSLGTAQTDSNGVAVKTYTSTGAGDVSLKAEADNGILVSEAYTIEDIYKYDSLTENKSQYTVKSGSANLTYSSDGVNITGNASDMTETIVEYNTPLPTNYTAELTLKSVSGTTSYGGFLFENLLMDFDSDGGGRCVLYQAPNYSRLTSFSTDLVNEVIKVEMQNGSLNFYINNVLKGTYTISSTGKYKHRTFRSRGLVVKDLKIKQL